MEIDFFSLALSFILLHEMDAIRCREWKIFPGLSLLPDRIGMILFIFAHIPLFYWVLSATLSGNDTFRFGFNIFLIIHFFLHILFLKHSKNEFKDWISWSIISGAGFFALIDLCFK